MKIPKIIRYLFYGVLFASAMYGIYKVVDSFGVEYTEPEVTQTEQV